MTGLSVSDETVKLTRESLNAVIEMFKNSASLANRWLPQVTYTTVSIEQYAEVERISEDNKITMEHAYWVWCGVMSLDDEKRHLSE